MKFPIQAGSVISLGCDNYWYSQARHLHFLAGGIPIHILVKQSKHVVRLFGSWEVTRDVS